MVYGNFDGQEVEEDRVCNPLGIYGALKYGSEKIIIGYNQTFDLPYTIIRPSALYGERCISRRVGQIFIENAINNHKIKIGGDGEDKLDFTYIEDVAEIIMRLIKKPAEQSLLKEGLSYPADSSWAPYRIFNIGNKKPRNARYTIWPKER